MPWTTCRCGATLESPSDRPAGAFRCPRCGEVVDLPSEQTAFAVGPLDDDLPSWRDDGTLPVPPVPKRTNILAVSAMFFAVLSLVFNLITALVAGLLGWYAQRRCDKDPSLGGRELAGRAMEVAVWATIANTVLLLFIPGLRTVRDGDMRGSMNLNNMKELALAAHTYNDVFKKLPPGYATQVGRKDEHSCFVWLLPFVEQAELFKHVDRFPKDQANRGDTNVHVFLSPYEEFQIGSGATSYAANIRILSEIGANTPPGEKVRRRPVMGKPLNLDQIKDGRSNVLLFTNRYADCDGVATLFDGMRPNEAGSPFFGAGSHVLPADGEPELNRTFQAAPTPKNCRSEASTYGHSFIESRLAVALCDGSVRFISKNIAPRMFQLALCPNDGNQDLILD